MIKQSNMIEKSNNSNKTGSMIFSIITIIIGAASLFTLSTNDMGNSCILVRIMLYIAGASTPFACHGLLRNLGWYKSKLHRRNRFIVPFILGFLLLAFTQSSYISTQLESCFPYVSNAGIFICHFLSYICIGYIIYAGKLSLNSVNLDWHLIHGNFLRKTINLVLLLPFLFTSILLLFGINETEIFKESNGDSVPSIFWSAYYHYIDPGNQQMTSPELRIWTTIVTSLGILLFNGLMVTSIIAWIDRRKERWLKGEEPYKRILKHTPHYVIIGGGDVTPGIVKQLIAKDSNGSEPYIVIQTSGKVERIRRIIYSQLKNDNEKKRIILRYGDRRSSTDLDKLYLASAIEIYVIGEDSLNDDTESYHDTMNMTCLKHIAEICDSEDTKKGIKEADTFEELRLKYKLSKKLICHVMFEYQTTFNVFQITDLKNEERVEERVEFRPFNYYEMWAQNVLVNRTLEFEEGYNGYLPLEGKDGIHPKDESYVHLVVIGMSRMGTAMAIEAAHLAHYPNFETRKKRTRITFIDANMKQEMNFFMGRFKSMFSLARHRYVNSSIQDDIFLETEESRWKNPLTDTDSTSPYKGDYLGKDFIDIEWEFIDGSAESPVIQKYITDISADNNAKLTIAICTPENNRAFATAIYLPVSVYESDKTLQVLVYQRLDDELVKSIDSNDKYYRKLKAFGMANDCYNNSLTDIADSISEYIDIAYESYFFEKMTKDPETSDETCLDELTDKIYSKITASDKKDTVIEKIITNIKESYAQYKERVSSNSEYDAIVSSFIGLVEHRNELLENIRKNKTEANSETTNNDSNKPMAAMKWSNKYNAYSMWSKFRCTDKKNGKVFNPLKMYFDKEQLEILGKVEHNRWTVEQLLMQYSPLEQKQQEEARITDNNSTDSKKKDLKKEYKHLDICSNEMLKNVDHEIPVLDIALTKILPYAYRKYIITQ